MFAKHAIRSEQGHVTASGEVEARYRARKGMAARPSARLPGADLRRSSSSTCRPRARSTGRSSASAPRSVRSRSIRSSASIMSRWPTRHARPARRSRAPAGGAGASSGRSARDLRSRRAAAACRRRCARGSGRSPSRCEAGEHLIGIWPGFVERAFGVAIDVGSTTIAAHLTDLHSGEVVASVGVMNPQIRFGEDLMSRVSYVMMNPGGDGELTRAVREAMDTLIGDRARPASSRRNPGSDRGRQSDHAPPRAWPRSDRARQGALRARDRPGPKPRARELGLDRAPGAFVYCAALHRRPCRRRHRRRHARRGAASQGRNDPYRRCRHQRRDRVRQSRAAVRLLLADRPGVRGRADLLRPARGAGRDRARAHRPRDARAAVQGDRLRSVVGRAGLRRGDRDASASPAFAARGSSR